MCPLFVNFTMRRTLLAKPLVWNRRRPFNHGDAGFQSGQRSFGYDADHLRIRLNAMFETYVDSGLLSGAVCDVRQNGREVYKRASGYLDLKENTPISHDSIFKIFSMTKPLTAALIFKLEEQKLLSLDDPLQKHLPIFKDLKVTRAGSLDSADWTAPDRDITIRHLLYHTAGFTYSFLGRTPLHRKYELLAIHARPGPSVSAPQTLSEVIERLASVPLLYQPGAQWSYGVSYDVLGAIAEAVAGEELGKAMYDHLLEPLGMKDTGFADDSYMRGRASRIATSYSTTAAGSAPIAETASGSAAYHTGGVHYGGGGLLSTAEDYHRFLGMLLAGGKCDGKQILPPDAVRQMISAPPSGVPVRGAQALSFRQLGGYAPTAGGGAALVDPGASAAPGSVGEFTWEGSESSHFFCDPSTGLAVLWLCQLRPLNTYPFLADLKRAIYGGHAPRRPAIHHHAAPAATAAAASG